MFGLEKPGARCELLFNFSKGQCTWGASCRFVHPGVLDKGNYNMFAPPRPILPTDQEPIEKVIFVFNLIETWKILCFF